ncbi:S8 family peptidase [Roseateles sp. LYH14W]|uniref:S8 family peptidase n=1 Tax=Pelomonas parva TaxID=3299032 RepID=A0ABW7F4G5_9BURK
MITVRNLAALSLLSAAMAAGAQNAQQKQYIVRLADAPAATYQGGVAGIAATRPAPGAKLNAAAANTRAYVSYLAQKRGAAIASIGNVPIQHAYSYAFNGFSAMLTDAQAAALRASGRALSVEPVERYRMDTTRTPDFLGLTAPGGLWSKFDPGARKALGEDVIIGIIDSGIWPENPSFGDRVNAAGQPIGYHESGGTLVYGPPPAKWKGACMNGAGFNASMCNNKLIGARYYHAGFDANPRAIRTSFEYLSPRDGDGHGTHTASTAGGNFGARAVIDGIDAGRMSGMAPRARIAAYKVCWEATIEEERGCYGNDSIKAIDDAVADGVDVLNYSVGGSQTNAADPVELAFLNAVAAGVFVATSAGNSGPGNQVAHIGPWMMTTAATTHDRYTVASVTLGNGSTYSGPSYQGTGLPTTPLILAQDAGVVPFANLSPTDQTALQRCYNASDRADPALGGSADARLDPAKVAGKTLVCIRGGNVLVNKADAVKLAGGAAMIIQNTPSSSDTLILQPYVVPSVHLPASNSAAVLAYAATSNANVTFGPGTQLAGVVAPVMGDFSSRGPNKGNANILKPDIAAPGVDVVAAYRDLSLTQAQHDAVASGTLTPAANAGSLQGTSMAAPHIAGIAALLKQLYPTWSPAAIKSAMMTSTNPVKLANGNVDPNPWGFGAGHVNPNAASDPGLVYDATATDFAKFLCGGGLTPPAGLGSCASVGSVSAANLNLASITVGDIVGSTTVTRTVTNVSSSPGIYTASANLPGWTVTASPNALSLAPGAKASFTLTLTRDTAPVGTWAFGSLTWSDGTRTVRSPVSARALAFAAPALVEDVRVSGSGSKVFQVTSSYTGVMKLSASGLVPATLTQGAVATGFEQCTNFTVPAGTRVARFQLFNAETQGGAATDLDLVITRGPNGTGPVVGNSGGTQANELVQLLRPTAATYSACVIGYATAGSASAAYTLSSWLVGEPSGPQTLRAAMPGQVYAGGKAAVAASWSVPAGARYLGDLRFSDGSNTLLADTVLFINNKP